MTNVINAYQNLYRDSYADELLSQVTATTQQMSTGVDLGRQQVRFHKYIKD